MATRKKGATTALRPYGSGDTSWFVRDRFGMFIHWGLYALPARHEWVRKREKLTAEQYQKYFDHFDPDLFDPRAWARTAREAGMKYFVITAKHHEGFCLWDTRHTDYKAPKTPCGRDLLRLVVDAFRAEGLRVGLYYSLIDWHHPEFPVDRIHPQAEDMEFRKATAKRDVRKYAAYMRDQVRELLTGYGPIDILWFDFSYPGEDGKGRDDWESEKLIQLIRKLQPNVIIDNRLDLPGAEDIQTPEQFVPVTGPTDAAGKPVVWEGCQTFSGSWGYHRDESSWKSVDMLVQMLVDHTSKGGNLLLNVGPTARGRFDERALDRLRGLGRWMELHSRSIYGCGAAPADLPAPRDCRYTWNAATNRLYLHLFAWPFGAVHLPEMEGRVRYAQFLHDASEVAFHAPRKAEHSHMAGETQRGTVTMKLPTQKPDVTVPVIEIFLQ